MGTGGRDDSKTLALYIYISMLNFEDLQNTQPIGGQYHGERPQVRVSTDIYSKTFMSNTLHKTPKDMFNGSTAQVVDGQDIFARLIQTVRKSSSGGLVDDTGHVKPGDLPGSFGRLPLSLIEAGRDGDARLTSFLVYCSAVSFILTSIMDESSSGGWNIRGETRGGENIYGQVRI